MSVSKYKIAVQIVLDLEIEEEKPSLAEDKATDLVRSALHQAFPNAKYCSISANFKTPQIGRLSKSAIE